MAAPASSTSSTSSLSSTSASTRSARGGRTPALSAEALLVRRREQARTERRARRVLPRLDAGRILLAPNSREHAEYAAEYWAAHAGNFRLFVVALLEWRTVVGILENAAARTLGQNEAGGRVEKAYNARVILRCYEATRADLVRCAGKGGAGGVREAKERLLASMDAYFCSADPEEDGRRRRRTVFALFFAWLARGEPVAGGGDPVAAVGADSAESAGGLGPESSSFREMFWPQLVGFFAKFLEVYDRWVKGARIDDVFLARIGRKEEKHAVRLAQQDAGVTREAWAQMEAPAGPAEPFEFAFDDLLALEEPSNPQFEVELQELQEAAEHVRVDHQALWNHKGKPFTRAWLALPHDAQREWVLRVRQMVEPQAKFGLIFCPELSAEHLCADGGRPLLALARECHAYTESIAALDPFVSRIAMRLKAVGKGGKKTLATVICSRRFVRCRFLVVAVMEILRLGQDGYSSPPEDDDDDDDDDDGGIADGVSAVSALELAPASASESASASASESASESASASASALGGEERCCATCGAGARGRALLACGPCKKAGVRVLYCGTDCQRKDWTRHKAACAGRGAGVGCSK